jgi:hypothetical protein
VKSKSFLLLAVAALPALAQTSAPANPYAPRTRGYTSLDNPYAAGGVYDPYRGGRPASSSQGAADIDLDEESTIPCADNHLASDVSDQARGNNARGNSGLGLGNSTRSIGSLNRPSTNGYGATSHCGRANQTPGGNLLK